ncbi:hypothetical protein [Pseudonocardia alaniniphila]|uniref:Transmembrane protein PGPGW n=1 Tax=Pseudonocardia alaniniphila TaxID=75291 RepID=A0ABS9THE4_9PSEU|nr:hypothetical protein [Pseudonocardia alaniniphila]MCH6167967.1 hypothetical protein [Pseudonocardia alaniniphila]
MRVLRVFGGVLLWLVATVLLVVALVLCLSVLLLPVGLLLGFAAVRLYGVGFRLLLPRSRDIRKGLRKEGRRWRRKMPLPQKRSGWLARTARRVRR